MRMCRAGTCIRRPRTSTRCSRQIARTPSKALTVTLSGQVETMRESYTGLFTGMALAIILVYLFLVINFQSWIDPLIVLMAVPFALGGVIWMLFLSQTHHERSRAHGHAHVHRPDDCQQHSGGQLCQSAHGGGRRSAARGGLPPAIRGCAPSS